MMLKKFASALAFANAELASLLRKALQHSFDRIADVAPERLLKDVAHGRTSDLRVIAAADEGVLRCLAFHFKQDVTFDLILFGVADLELTTDISQAKPGNRRSVFSAPLWRCR